MNKYKLYIASPLGFTESGRLFLYEKLIPLVENAGFSVIDPWKLTDQEYLNSIMTMDNGIDKVNFMKEMNKKIAENNTKGIYESDGLLAVLDGTDVDSGTASEIGFASAIGKKVTAYRSDFRLSGDNEAAKVNLQVEYFIGSGGGRIVNNIDELPGELKSLFT